MTSSPASATRTGFTLIELIVVIVIIGVVAAMLGTFIKLPVQGYADLGRRAALVDSTEGALRRMARDIRIALPNSVRITTTASGYALELIPTLDGGRYFTTSGTPGRDLDFTAADTDFEINGCFQGLASFSAGHRLVINNLGTTGNDSVYTAAGTQSVVTPAAGTTITLSVSPATGACGTGGRVHHINLNLGYRFKQTSPRKRLFVFDAAQAPVTYLCNTTAGTLTRYAGYTVNNAAQPTDPAVAPLSAAASIARMADHVNVCNLTVTSAETTTDVQTRGLVTLDLGLADQGESVRLVHQVMLDNSR